MKSIEPPCQHFGMCGGCDLQNHSYSDQLLLKQERLKQLFGKSIPVNPAPITLAYRSRVDFIFGKDRLGLRKKGSATDIVDIKECLLISSQMRALFSHIKQSLKDFSSYDLTTYKGLLRYVTLRQGDRDNMVIFTTTSPSPDEEMQFKKFLQSLVAKSVYWFVDDGKSDDVGRGKLKKQFGSLTITCTLNKISYELGPFTFFQSNYAVAEQMFSKIAEYAKGNVLDLYCGIGAIARQVAPFADHVVGVESYAPSIIEAKKSQDAEFICEDSSVYLKELLILGDSFDTVIVDPPRTGLGLKACQSLKRLAPKTIIYMSCNPQTLRTDLALLNSYEEIFFEAYDMFPQTFHVECLAVLRKQ